MNTRFFYLGGGDATREKMGASMLTYIGTSNLTMVVKGAGT